MKRGTDWRWVVGRKLKGLPVKRTFEERYRSDVLVGPGTLDVGRWTHWFPSSTFYTWTSSDHISIGSYTSIAAGTVLVCGGEHRTEQLSTYTFSIMTGEPVEMNRIDPGTIRIGNDVWIATEAMVLAPVTIGDGAVVAARSVVTRDVPPYAIVAGAPARIIRYRFDPETAARLQRLEWWDWPDGLVRAAIPLLRASNITSLEDFAARNGLDTADDA